jgi:hypothetical protein
MRMRFLRDPGRSANSLSFMDVSLRLVHDADEVFDLLDHAADLRRILERPRAVELVEAEADQRSGLLGWTARGFSCAFSASKVARMTL